MPNTAGADSESVEELAEEGNAFEADAVEGVEEGEHASEVRTRQVPEDDVPGYHGPFRLVGSGAQGPIATRNRYFMPVRPVFRQDVYTRLDECEAARDTAARLQPHEDSRRLLQVQEQGWGWGRPRRDPSRNQDHQYNRQKLLRFAEVCRVKKIVVAAADEAEHAIKSRSQRKTAGTWDSEVLRQEVWAEPLRVVARRYGVSDVALAKRCRKLGIPLPGRGYWAKKAVS